MRRLFIIRKDLHLSSGKLAAMVGHCAEAYFTNLLRNGEISRIYYEDHSEDEIKVVIPSKIMDDYINNSFVKTVCEARNLNHLLKAVSLAKDLGLTEDVDFGLINDKCLTELTPENEDGTCTVGIWFKPLDDEVSKKISKKYQLYKD